MHLMWWIIWVGFMSWNFFTTNDIPEERKTKDSPPNILQKSFAAEQITKENYLEHKTILENDLSN